MYHFYIFIIVMPDVSANSKVFRASLVVIYGYRSVAYYSIASPTPHSPFIHYKYQVDFISIYIYHTHIYIYRQIYVRVYCDVPGTKYFVLVILLAVLKNVVLIYCVVRCTCKSAPVASSGAFSWS